MRESTIRLYCRYLGTDVWAVLRLRNGGFADNASGVVVVQGAGGAWRLHTTGPQDHEAPAGPRRGARLTCTSSGLSGGPRNRAVEAPLAIELLDQDDNAPVPQTDKVYLWLPSLHVHQVGAQTPQGKNKV